MAINESLLKVLACPSCKTEIEFVRESWLVCNSCDRKYPIKNDIPVMLIEEGDKYISLSIEELPDPNEL
jgi:hypothetical protein